MMEEMLAFFDEHEDFRLGQVSFDPCQEML